MKRRKGDTWPLRKTRGGIAVRSRGGGESEHLYGTSETERSYQRGRNDADLPILEQVRQVATWGCDSIVPRALISKRENNPAKANPNVVISGGLDGKPFKSADGYQQQLIFGLSDENGERGKGWYTKVRNISFILFACRSLCGRFIV